MMDPVALFHWLKKPPGLRNQLLPENTHHTSGIDYTLKPGFRQSQ
jgi:hypothetical protein